MPKRADFYACAYTKELKKMLPEELNQRRKKEHKKRKFSKGMEYFKIFFFPITYSILQSTYSFFDCNHC